MPLKTVPKLIKPFKTEFQLMWPTSSYEIRQHPYLSGVLKILKSIQQVIPLSFHVLKFKYERIVSKS